MSRKTSKLLIYSFVLVISFLLLFVHPGFFSPLRIKVVEGVSLPVRILSFPIREIKKMLFYHRTFDEYRRLKQEVHTLKARLIGLDEVLIENNRLVDLLDFKRKLIFSSTAANVVGRDPSNWDATLIIDKGHQDGIRVGMPVVSALGVVGNISEVTEHKAKVILLTDPNFSVAALVKRSRENGLVSGTLQEGLCHMRYLSKDADIKVGDQVVTSKLSSSFPEGLLIGEIINVEVKADDLSVFCTLQPAVPLSQIEEVLVIRKNEE